MTDQAEVLDGISVITAKVEGGYERDCVIWVTSSKRKWRGRIVIASVADLQSQPDAATATDGVVKKGAYAGNLIKAIAGLVGGAAVTPEHGSGYGKNRTAWTRHLQRQKRPQKSNWRSVWH